MEISSVICFDERCHHTALVWADHAAFPRLFLVRTFSADWSASVRSSSETSSASGERMTFTRSVVWVHSRGLPPAAGRGVRVRSSRSSRLSRPSIDARASCCCSAGSAILLN